MGVCTSKKNRSFEENNNNTNNKCKSIVKKCNHEFGLIVIGFIREIISKFNVYYKLNNLPSSIQQLCKLYFGSIHGDLIVKPGQTCRLNDLKNQIFEYNSILIKKNATLTLNRYNPNNSTGGILNLLCNGNIILEEGAKISMNGRGYYGGQYGRFGQSYINNNNKTKTKTRKSNYGGGGGGQISVFSEYGPQSSCGGGGGYGTNGYDGKIIYDINKENDCNEDAVLINDNVEYGIGGNMYGNKYLNPLYLGSGGGSGYYFDEIDNALRANKGGAGGGAIKLECFGDIIMNNNSEILCNGNKGKGLMAGGGSGGSIHIIIKNKNNLQMNKNAKIEAIGGINMNNIGNGGNGRIRIEYLCNNKNAKIEAIGGINMNNIGNGGNGRIRIEYLCNNKNENACYHNITPQPYIG